MKSTTTDIVAYQPARCRVKLVFEDKHFNLCLCGLKFGSCIFCVFFLLVNSLYKHNYLVVHRGI